MNWAHIRRQCRSIFVLWPKAASVIVFTAAFVLSLPDQATAEFPLNFQPVNPDTAWRTSSGRTSPVPYVLNQTPIALEKKYSIYDYEGPEMVTDPTNGKVYYHVLIGSMADGFIQETFIETDPTVRYGSNGINVWGYGPVTWNRPGSASGGGINDLTYPCCGPMQISNGNQTRIFSADAGNGSADPRKVIVRQLYSVNGLTMEFLKDKYDKKPLIYQNIDTPEIQMTFIADMRSLTYSDASTPISITNEMLLKGADAPPLMFDVTTSSGSKTNVTAGQFTYTPGNYAPTDGYGAGSGGTYTYTGGEFNHYATDWASFIDPGVYNPWSYVQQ